MKRRTSNTARRAGLIAVAVALAAALAAAASRRTPLRRAATPDRRPEPYTCRCGATYRVSGTDRHRVYWPADAPEDEPVMGDRCVNCDAPLPTGRATAAA